jgi:mannose-6-phosphate isomerase-like protein (cupin superfamily)
MSSVQKNERNQPRGPHMPFQPARSSAPGTSVCQVDFEGGLHPPFETSVFTVEAGAVSKLDQHSVVESWFVCRGTGEIEYDDIPYQINEGDYLLLRSTVTHRVRNTGPGDLIILSTWWRTP